MMEYRHIGGVRPVLIAVSLFMVSRTAVGKETDRTEAPYFHVSDADTGGRCIAAEIESRGSGDRRRHRRGDAGAGV